jgi:hypothetical protein
MGVMMRVALDRDVIRSYLNAVVGAADIDTIGALLGVVTACVLPVIAEEIDREGDDRERQWRRAGFEEIQADEFFKGCAAGMARRYVDYYADPRDCRVVAEAECAQCEVLVTLKEELVAGLSGRTEKVIINTPSDALKRCINNPSPNER